MLDRFGAQRRAVVMGGAGVAVLLLALGITRLAGGGAEDPFDQLPQVVASGAVSTPTSPAVATAPLSGTGAPAAAAPATPPASGDPAGGDPAGGDHHADGFETATLRDPFCPLVASVVTGNAGVNCPEQAPPVPDAPFTLLDVFIDNKTPHARVRLGPSVHVLHVNDPFGDYRVASLAETCGEFTRGAERRTVCEGQDWAAAAAGAPARP